MRCCEANESHVKQSGKADLSMAGNDIAETKNEEPKIGQTYPLCLFALMRANAAISLQRS